MPRRSGRDLLADVFEYFGSGRINRFDGLWVRDSSFRANYDEYMSNINSKKTSPEDAAWGTWTGRELKAQGFTRVKVTADHDAGIITPVFSK